MDCNIIRKRKRLIIRFTEDDIGEINKFTICCMSKSILEYYGISPELAIHLNSIDLVVFLRDSTVLDAIKSFVKDILLPHYQNTGGCADCTKKRRPPYCNK